MTVLALAFAAASLLTVQITGPRAVLTPRDAPRVVVIVDYRGPGYVQNLIATVSATGGRITPQRGTTCFRTGSGTLDCPLYPIRHGSSVWLSFLATQLHSGHPLRVTAVAHAPVAGRARATLIRPVRAA